MGPLKDVKIIEFAGIGPGPFCGMLLADLGAEVIRIERKDNEGKGDINDIHNRSKKSITADLKNKETIGEILKLISQVDGIIEGFRPGVMEKLGLSPDTCLLKNSKLVYGRMTGWGQDGPMAYTAGHDINYISMVGALHAIGKKDQNPSVPLNLVGDYGGGGMHLAVGMLAGLFHAIKTGEGQIVDSAMIDGSASLMGFFYYLHNVGFWKDERESNLLDGFAHFYDTYETLDKKYIAIGSIEPQFYKILIDNLGLNFEDFKNQMDKSLWPELKKRIAKAVSSKTRSEWTKIFSGIDACVTPVLSINESFNDSHHLDRKTFTKVGDYNQPSPSPRFSSSSLDLPNLAHPAGTDNDEIFAKFNLDPSKFK